MDYGNSMNEIIFEVIQEADGGFVAECLTESIFTQAVSWDELRRNVKETVGAYFFDKVQPSLIRLGMAGELRRVNLWQSRERYLSLFRLWLCVP